MNRSIIIITYNSADTIDACLEGVARLDLPEPPEVIVLDNASTDGTAERVRQRHPRARLLLETENWGFAGGVNRAVQAAGGEICLLLNPDAVPQPGWAGELAAALQAPGVGVAGSKVLGPDGRIQSLGSSLDVRTLLSAHRADGQADAGQPGEIEDVWSVHGAAMGFRRELWERLGGFDEGFFPAYWEESDFCERARRAGERVVVAPSAIVQHTEASSTGKYSPQFYGYYHRNRLRYAAKWLPWTELWGVFRPAEHERLRTAPPLDRRVARLVYEAGVPSLTIPTEAERERVRALGAALRSRALPDDGYEAVLAQLAEAEANSVHHETAFVSRFSAVARLRAAWNSVATRWYVRPNFDQQTRYNLAAQRALAAFAERAAADAAASALDVALLAWKAGEQS